MKRHDRAAEVAFWLYCALMLWLLFGQRMGIGSSAPYLEQLRWNLNLIPFYTIGEYTELLIESGGGYWFRHALINLAGNVVMFVPLGFFLPCLWEKLRKWWKSMLLVVGIITVVELVQLFTLLGSCDIDDLILNVIGAELGYGLFRLTGQMRKAD